MTVVDLRFRRAAAGTQPLDLRLGRIGSGAPPPPPPPPADPRPGLLRAHVATPWSAATSLSATAAPAPWRSAGRIGRSWVDRWAAGALVGEAAALPWGSTRSVAGSTLLPWGSTRAVAGASRLPWAATQALQRSALLPWQSGRPVAGITEAAWRAAERAARLVLAAWRPGQPARTAAVASARQALATGLKTLAPWQAGRPVQSIGGPWTPPAPPSPPGPGCWIPEPGDAVALVFKQAMAGVARLVFACRRPALVVVPVRRVYMVTNITTLTRVDDGAPVPCFGFSLSLDVDSWAWGFSAELSAEALPLLQPAVPGEPVVLEASVNGTPFRVIPRSISRARNGVDAVSLRVDGVGHTAVLDQPFAPVQVFSAAAARTSQQLLDAALPVDWSADWGLTAWLVPGGLWSHQGTPASAARAIAAAGGAHLLPHPSLQRMAVLPRYPVAPWAWADASPDLELPASVVVNEGVEWQDLPRYNGVWVSGTGPGGVQRLVRRLGTAGDALAPMVTDRLITHADAARQAGLPVLAGTGSKVFLSLGLPVLPATGVILPGKLVRYTEGSAVQLGLVRGVRVEVNAGSGVQPTEVWQTIRVETQA